MKKHALVRLAAAFAVTMIAPAALAADALLSGVIKSQSGRSHGRRHGVGQGRG